MQRRMVQRGFALGVIGVLGAMFIAAPVSGSTAQEGPEGIQPVGAEEGVDEQALTAEEQEAMRAWVASMAEASPMGGNGQFECSEEPYKCQQRIECKFPNDVEFCFTSKCDTGACSGCPPFLSNIVIKSWCAYNCKRVDKVVASAFVLKTRWGNNGPWCIDKDGKIYRDGELKWPMGH